MCVDMHLFPPQNNRGEWNFICGAQIQLTLIILKKYVHLVSSSVLTDVAFSTAAACDVILLLSGGRSGGAECSVVSADSL